MRYEEGFARVPKIEEMPTIDPNPWYVVAAGVKLGALGGSLSGSACSARRAAL